MLYLTHQVEVQVYQKSLKILKKYIGPIDSNDVEQIIKIVKKK